MHNTKLRKRVATRCAKKVRKSEGKMFTRKVRKRVSRQKKNLNLWENVLYRSDKIIAEPVKKDNQLCPGILGKPSRIKSQVSMDTFRTSLSPPPGSTDA